MTHVSECYRTNGEEEEEKPLEDGGAEEDREREKWEVGYLSVIPLLNLSNDPEVTLWMEGRKKPWVGTLFWFL